jgi:GNAT superfamily N-acetyltransferase
MAGAACLRLDALPGNRMFNHVLGAGVAADADPEHLDRIAAFYDGAPHAIAVSPGARPTGLAGRLAARGYRADYAWMKFWRGVDDPPPVATDLRMLPVRERDAEAFGHVVARSFGLPAFMEEWLAAVPGRDGWHCWLARANGRPAGAGGFFVSGRAAWLAFGATLPEHRGRGGQRARFAAQIQAAAEAGCTLLATETGQAVAGRPSNSYRNILWAGFQPVYLRPNLGSPT